MDPATLSGIGSALSGIGAVGSLFGGESKSGIRAQEQMHYSNLKAQEAFAQQGIRWRVEDAKKAGIHPLYALGASIPSYSPSTFIPGESGRRRDFGGALSGLGDAVSGVARSMEAGRSARESLEGKLNDLTLKRAELENDLLSSQIALIQQQAQPRMPEITKQAIPGQSDVERNGLLIKPTRAHVVEKPQEVTKTYPGAPWQEPHEISDLGFARTATGLVPVPSKDMKERIEDMMWPEFAWSLRNQMLPDVSASPPASLLPPGAVKWKYNMSKGEWQPEYEGGRSYDQVINPSKWSRWLDSPNFKIEYRKGGD